jgi:uncharacterized membrane protein
MGSRRRAFSLTACRRTDRDLFRVERMAVIWFVAMRGKMKKRYPFLLMLGVTALTILAFPRFPDRMPMHWGPWGSPDAWGSRLSGAILLPSVMICIWIITQVASLAIPTSNNEAALLARLDDRVYYSGSQEQVPIVRNFIMTFLALLHVLVLGSALGFWRPLERWFS